MKVNDPKQPTSSVPTISGAQEAPGAGASSAAPTGLDIADRVTTEEATRLREGVTNGRRMAAGERALRLQSLAQEVRSGAYRPNVSRLAEEILNQAELEARLAQTLG